MKNDIDIENFSYLVRLFSTKMYKELLQNKSSKIFDEIIRNTNILNNISYNCSLKEVLDIAYNILLKKYRCEYVYKNIIVNKIVLGKHSSSNSFIINELPVYNCKADSVVLNGTSTVYEIKTKYDNLERIERQVNAYEKAFDKINIVIDSDDSKSNNLTKILPKNVGILVMGMNGEMSEYKKAVSNKAHIDNDIIFNILHKNEYISILRSNGFIVSDIPNMKIHRECKEMFSTLSKEVAHKEMVSALKKRGKPLSEFIFNIPESLKAVALKNCFTKNERMNFIDMLNLPICEVLN